jgi:hypothetical protein
LLANCDIKLAHLKSTFVVESDMDQTSTTEHKLEVNLLSPSGKQFQIILCLNKDMTDGTFEGERHFKLSFKKPDNYGVDNKERIEDICNGSLNDCSVTFTNKKSIADMLQLAHQALELKYITIDRLWKILLKIFDSVASMNTALIDSIDIYTGEVM